MPGSPYFDHPRGSGKTRVIAMMAFTSLRFLSARLVFLIADRKDLEKDLGDEVERFLYANGYPESMSFSIRTLIIQAGEFVRELHHLMH